MTSRRKPVIKGVVLAGIFALIIVVIWLAAAAPPATTKPVPGHRIASPTAAYPR